MTQMLKVLLCIFVFCAGMHAGMLKGEEIDIEKGSKVSFDYTLTVDGEVVDSSDGRDPFTYTHGEGQIVPGLERNLEGLHVGDEKEVSVSPEEGYGVVDPNAFKDVPRSTLPPNVNIDPGMMLQAQNPNGNVITVKVIELKDDTVTIDFNHPLAGKTLDFQVKIVSIN